MPNNRLLYDRGENVLVVFHFLLFPWSTLGVKWTNDTGRRRELERGTEGSKWSHSTLAMAGGQGCQIVVDGLSSLPGGAREGSPRASPVRCGGQIRCAKFLQGEIGCISLMEVTPAQPHLGVPGPFLSASHSTAPAQNTTARGQAGMGALEIPRTLESQL